MLHLGGMLTHFIAIAAQRQRAIVCRKCCDFDGRKQKEVMYEKKNIQNTKKLSKKVLALFSGACVFVFFVEKFVFFMDAKTYEWHMLDFFLIFRSNIFLSPPIKIGQNYAMFIF